MTQHDHNPSRRLALRAGLALPLLAAAGMGFATSAEAGDRQEKARELAAIRAAVQRGELLPLPRIMDLARARVPGDVVKTELESKRERLIYEVKILTRAGRVREVKLDARTGRILRVEDD
ncbi:MAG TPA: PepSY domain-containing protein [Sphingomonadaceae bacterium]|nr:PepSY domain-containing protein [Sphingomonadaceae bacterium]